MRAGSGPQPPRRNTTRVPDRTRIRSGIPQILVPPEAINRLAADAAEAGAERIFCLAIRGGWHPKGRRQAGIQSKSPRPAFGRAAARRQRARRVGPRGRYARANRHRRRALASAESSANSSRAQARVRGKYQAKPASGAPAPDDCTIPASPTSSWRRSCQQGVKVSSAHWRVNARAKRARVFRPHRRSLRRGG